MASELHVDAIKHSGGTSALTINSSGHVHSAGHIIQVKESTITTQISTTSTSLGATGHIVSITPKFANSKLIISLSGGEQTYSGSGIIVGHINLFREKPGVAYDDIGQITENTMGGDIYGATHGAEFVDTTHNTTGTINYQTYIKTGSGKTYYYNYAPSYCVFKVMEVAQ